MHRPSLQKHAYYLPLFIGIGLWMMIKVKHRSQLTTFHGSSATAEGAAPVVHEFLGTSTSAVVTSESRPRFLTGMPRSVGRLTWR